MLVITVGLGLCAMVCQVIGASFKCFGVPDSH